MSYLLLHERIPFSFDRSGIPPVYIPRVCLNANVAETLADLGSSTNAYRPYSGNSIRPSQDLPELTHSETWVRSSINPPEEGRTPASFSWFKMCIPSFNRSSLVFRLCIAYRRNRFLKSATLALNDGLFHSTHLERAPGVSGFCQLSPIPEWRLRYLKRRVLSLCLV